MNVLVVAPHPDDEAIGCGGSICLHSDKGHRVAVAFVTSGELGVGDVSREAAWKIREREALAAAEILGVASTSFLRLPDWYVADAPEHATSALVRVLREECPEVVYVPHAQEWHRDHQAALPALLGACREASLRPREIRTYEVWTPLAHHDHVRDVTSVMRRKLLAIRCYPSQLAAFRYDRAVRGLNAYRGVIAGRCRYAEVFGVINPAAVPPPPPEGGSP
jgi:LmbE family N-acetylglucosaminyl deacetylase